MVKIEHLDCLVAELNKLTGLDYEITFADESCPMELVMQSNRNELLISLSKRRMFDWLSGMIMVAKTFTKVV